MILGTLKSLPKTTNSIDEISSEQAKVGNIVLGQNQLWIPIRLEMGVIKMTIHINLVFIGVKDTCVRVIIDGLNQVQEGMRSQQIVMIHQGHILTSSKCQR